MRRGGSFACVRCRPIRDSEHGEAGGFDERANADQSIEVLAFAAGGCREALARMSG